MKYLFALGLILSALKLFGVVKFSWWLVLLPFYIVPAAWLLIVLGTIAAVLFLGFASVVFASVTE